jgi:leucyl-tRNA synthetase
MLGNKNNYRWPVSKQELLIENSINFVVQINGKKRAVISSNRNTSENDLFELIKNNPATKKYIENKVIKKNIFIPNKLINIIL